MSLNLSHDLTVIEVSGDNAETFLQSQLTQDIHAREKNQIQWQAYCSRDGLVHSLFGLFGEGKKYFLILPNALTENTLALLKKYGALSKVESQLLSNIKIDMQLEQGDESYPHWELTAWDGGQLQLRWCSRFEIPEYIKDDDVLRDLFIQHAFPWLQEATIAKFRPHDLNLPELGVIGFKKGCFPGQEIIARMQYRGTPKFGLYAYRLAGLHPLKAGQALMDGEKNVGTVVDVIFSEDHTDVSFVLAHDHVPNDVLLRFPQ